jgi:hypothetical protein
MKIRTVSSRHTAAIPYTVEEIELRHDCLALRLRPVNSWAGRKTLRPGLMLIVEPAEIARIVAEVGKDGATPAQPASPRRTRKR